MRSPRFSAPALRGAAAALLLLFALPLAAYTVFLKDGSSVISRGKYEIRKGKAIITLPNGTQTFVDASQIDVARTEAANRGTDYGTTELGNTRVMPGDETPPPVNKSISDLIATHRPSKRELPSAKRAREETPGQLATSRAGALDLAKLPHVPYGRAEVTAEVQQFFRSQGVEEVEVFGGSRPDRLLVEVTTGSEGSVFQSLTASANALMQLRERFPQAVEAIELLMKTPAREKAGQFVLTPELAIALVSKKVEPPAFFIANVQF
jgi:hypothetical protein